MEHLIGWISGLHFMDINHFHCPACGCRIESWVARQPEFHCPDCAQGFHSNYRHSLKRSALFGLLLWIGGTGLGCLLIDPWQMVLAFAIELGGLLAFFAAFLLHRYSIRITQTFNNVPITARHG